MSEIVCNEYVINFDGSCGPKNPGSRAGWGYTIKKNGIFYKKDSGELSGATFTNNYAEFYALFKALEFLADVLLTSDRLFIRGDSQLVIKMMRGRWSPNKGGIYVPAYVLALQELVNIRARKIPVSIDWVPREMNTEADALSTEYR